jgi:hypothetical protein
MTGSFLQIIPRNTNGQIFLFQRILYYLVTRLRRLYKNMWKLPQNDIEKDGTKKKPSSFITALLKIFFVLFVENCYCIVSVNIKHLIRGCDFDCRLLHLDLCCPKWYWDNSPITYLPLSVSFCQCCLYFIFSCQYHSGSAADSYFVLLQSKLVILISGSLLNV